jgi:hypothetical protein
MNHAKADAMKEVHEEKLLGQYLSGDPPRAEFRDQTLRDSTAVFAHVRGRRSAWRKAELAVAAVLIAGVSFLAGHLSRPELPRPRLDSGLTA